MTKEPINVDISKQDLNLWICGTCYAITLKSDKDKHAEWHRNN